MKKTRLAVAGLMVAVSVCFASGVFADEGLIGSVSPDMRAKVNITKSQNLATFPETYYPAVSPNISAKVDKGEPLLLPGQPIVPRYLRASKAWCPSTVAVEGR